MNKAHDKTASGRLASAAQRSGTEDLYRAVLADLYRKKDEISAAIVALEQFLSPMGGEFVLDLDRLGLAAMQQPTRSPIVSASILAALHTLGGAGRNSDIKRVMLESGFRFKGDPIVSIAQGLARLAALDQVEKVQRGSWRLK